jgi:DNA-binding MarR family transcriptional regulator
LRSQESSGDINKLPDLSLIRTSWILSQRLADVFRRFDVGKGGIAPVRAFKMDHHTPLAGQYFCLRFDNLKRAFLPDESTKVSDFVKGVWTTDPDFSDGNIVCSIARREPALTRETEATLAHIRALWRDLFRNPFAEAEASGLTGPQVTLIASLVSRGPMTLTELSRAWGMSHSTASGIVDRLASRGLLQRTPDATDRRRRRIVVTDKVTRYVRELEAGPAGRLATALAAATTEQRRSITSGLQLLRELLDRAGPRKAS